jgi:hypothetical protein
LGYHLVLDTAHSPPAPFNMPCEKCSGMLDLDNLMVEEGYAHHASYTSLAASSRSGCELCQCIKDQHQVRAGGVLDDAYDQVMPFEDTLILCFAFDRKENIRSIRTIRTAQHVRFKRKHALDVKMPYLFFSLRLSTSASIYCFQFPRHFTFSFSHR